MIFKLKLKVDGRSELTTENDPYAPLTELFHYSRAHFLHTDLNTFIRFL